MENNQAKRTIKLKPLTKKSVSPDQPGTENIAPTAATPGIPAATVRPAAMLKVNPSSPTIQSPAMTGDENAEDTVSMPPEEIGEAMDAQTQKVARTPTQITPLSPGEKQTIKLKPATLVSQAAPAMPGGPTLGPIKLKPVTTPAPLAPPLTPDSKTVSLSPVAPSPDKTVLLSPEGAPSADQSATDSSIAKGGVEDEQTVAIPRKPVRPMIPPLALTPAVPGMTTAGNEDTRPPEERTVSIPRKMPGPDGEPADTSTADMGAVGHSSPTMKLTPTAAAPAGQAAAGRTIKLKPVAPAKPSSPTVKADGQPVTTAGPAVPKPSSPTIKLTAAIPAPAATQPGAAPEGESADTDATQAAQPKSRLSIRKADEGGASSVSDMKEGQLGPSGAGASAASAGEEASMLTVATSAAAMVALLILTVLLAVQYANIWLGQNIQLPVLSQLVK